MGCLRFYDQRTEKGFRHCSHIEIVTCKACINAHKRKGKDKNENSNSLRVFGNG